jgi:hypothetical protein
MRPNALESSAVRSPLMNGQNVYHAMQLAAPTTAIARNAMVLDGSLPDTKINSI